MATPIWTFPYLYPLGWQRKYEKTRLALGSGNDIVVSRDVAFTHATGYRGTGSYAGVNHFTIKLKVPFYHASLTDWADVLGFLQAREDADNEPFYFYNALENAVTSTWTGDTASGPTNDLDGLACTNTTGRYLVRVFGDIDINIQIGRQVEISLTLEEVVA